MAVSGTKRSRGGVNRYRGTTTQRGYGAAHQAERKRQTPLVKAGRAWCSEPICLMPDRWMHPDAPWDLAHNRETGGYRGPAHRRCNRAEGARWLNVLRRKKAPRRLAL